MRGRPILGAIAGLFFGAFVAIDLMMFGVRPLDRLSAYGLPAVGLVLGLALGLWAPLGRKRAAARSSAGAPPPAAGAADEAETPPPPPAPAG